MTEKSSIFDSIRIKSRRSAKQAENIDICEWDGCNNPGTHRAPKKNRADNEFHKFCLAHVRKYNQSFNYFAGKEDELNENMRRAAFGEERPTWRMGTNPNAKTYAKRTKPADPNNLYARLAARNRGDNPGKAPPRRLVEADRRALEVLGLKGKHGAQDIKIAYKRLVKIHHPDVNGGDKSSEDRLRSIISAYNHLKKKGLV